MKQVIKRSLQCLAAGLLILSISGCANNSTITQSYIDPTVKNLNLKGVLVVAVAKKMENRIDYEDAFTSALRKRGVNAVASHTLVPGTKPTKEKVVAAAQKAKLDTILITRYMGETSQEVFHPGTIYYDVAPMYSPRAYGGWGGYYGHAYEVAYQQPVWSTNITYTLASDLFATESKLHMWQAVSDTIKAGSMKKLRDDFISSFVDNMKDEGLFK